MTADCWLEGMGNMFQKHWSDAGTEPSWGITIQY